MAAEPAAPRRPSLPSVYPPRPSRLPIPGPRPGVCRSPSLTRLRSVIRRHRRPSGDVVVCWVRGDRRLSPRRAAPRPGALARARVVGSPASRRGPAAVSASPRSRRAGGEGGGSGPRPEPRRPRPRERVSASERARAGRASERLPGARGPALGPRRGCGPRWWCGWGEEVRGRGSPPTLVPPRCAAAAARRAPSWSRAWAVGRAPVFASPPFLAVGVGPRRVARAPRPAPRLRPAPCARAFPYLVDPASSICLSQRLSHACLSTHGRYSETANGSLNQLWFLWSLAPLLLG